MLGLQPNKPVAFEVEDGAVRIVAAPMTLEEAYGAVPPLTRPEDFEHIVEVAHEDQAIRASKQG